MRLAELHAIKMGVLQDFPQEMSFGAGHVFQHFLQMQRSKFAYFSFDGVVNAYIWP